MNYRYNIIYNLTIFRFNRSFSTTGYKFLPGDDKNSIGESSRPVSNNDSQGNNSRVIGRAPFCLYIARSSPSVTYFFIERYQRIEGTPI